MNRTQTLGQFTGLPLRGKCLRHNITKSEGNLSGYGEAHSQSYSSSVADPSHSPIERGQQHGLRVRVCSRFRVMGVGGGDVVVRYRNNKLGNKTRRRKGIKICLQDLLKIMTRGLKSSQRSLDG